MLVLIVLWTAALAMTPAHRAHHSEMDLALHQGCVVCLFAHAQVMAADAAPASLGLTAPRLSVVPQPDTAPDARREFQLPLGRAPPAGS